MMFKLKLSFLESKEKLELSVGVKAHNKEFKARLFHLAVFFFLLLVLCFSQIKIITRILEAPIEGIKFFQPAPDVYFFLSLKVSFWIALICISPFFTFSAICYFFPAFVRKENFVFRGLFFLSYLFIFIGSLFGYKIVIPAALSFFFSYTRDVLEPLWSFQDYINLFWTFLLTSIFSFQLPLLQILTSSLGFCTAQSCLIYLRYVCLVSTIIAALITPSTDPVTQFIFSIAFIVLYSMGSGLLYLLEKGKILC